MGSLGARPRLPRRAVPRSRSVAFCCRTFLPVLLAILLTSSAGVLAGLDEPAVTAADYPAVYPPYAELEGADPAPFEEGEEEGRQRGLVEEDDAASYEVYAEETPSPRAQEAISPPVVVDALIPRSRPTASSRRARAATKSLSEGTRRRHRLIGYAVLAGTALAFLAMFMRRGQKAPPTERRRESSDVDAQLRSEAAATPPSHRRRLPKRLFEDIEMQVLGGARERRLSDARNMPHVELKLDEFDLL